jgi:sec-independent protein translocase protein TatA
MAPLAFLGGLGPWEVIVIAFVALLLFGKRLPEVAKSAGKAVVQFKKGLREVEDEIESEEKEETAKTPKSPEAEEKQEKEEKKG